MHKIQLEEIIRDAELAHAIRPIARKHHLSIETLTDLLNKASLPRASGVAQLVGASA